MRTTDETRLESLAHRRAELLAQPYSTDASREIERIDAELDAFWASLDPKEPPDAT